jgi:hypothetical protein
MFYRFLALSLIVHMLVTATMLQLEAPTLQKPRTIDVTYLDELPQRKNKTFVTDPNLKPLQKSLDKLKEQVDRISKETQRVEQEQIARQKGPTQNAAQRAQLGREGRGRGESGSGTERGSPAKSANRSRFNFPRPEARESEIATNHSPPGIDRPMNGGAAERVTLSESAIAEFIPEVREGGFTSLNTDQFLHYTFYARINEQVRNRWVQHLRTFANNAGPTVLNRLSQSPQVTELEVLLDKEGNFQDIIFHRRADHGDLDIAAGAALERSAPFLNPPSELVKKDGYIHLFYAFYIHWRPQYIAKPNQ